MTISQWIHLKESNPDKWVYKIYSVADNCNCGNDDENFREGIRSIGQHITLKRGGIAAIISRIVAERTDLISSVEKYSENNVSNESKEGYAFKVNDDLKYRLMIDIEFLLIQLKSCWEITKRFESYIHKHVGNEYQSKEINNKIDQILKSEKNSRWISRLTSHRNFLAHEGSIYLAVDISSSEKQDWDILIMKKVFKSFENSKNYFTLSEVISIKDGFIDAMDIMRDSLIDTLER